jgi:hypothetical protein
MQWRTTMVTYAYPIIGHVEVRDIDTEMIVRILQPIWMKKAETARRVRGRIKAILDAEAVLGHREGDNLAVGFLIFIHAALRLWLKQNLHRLPACHPITATAPMSN